MNPKIEEIVKSLRGCKAGLAGGCRDCLMYEKGGCLSALHDVAADLIEQLQQELSACISDMTAYAQRKIKDECDLCKHAAPREFCREADYCCSLCNHTRACVCAFCQRADLFEWRGVLMPKPPKEDNHDANN